jgi:DNA repair protein RecN (Recombination protein N)
VVLRELSLRNVGVIETAGVEFASGLNVVTGETGVGKTLLVTSLALVCGGRAPGRLVGSAAGDASVEAVVEVPQPLRERLAAAGVEISPEAIVARRVTADGRSKAWVDGRLVPAAVLSEIGEALIEVHGQGAGFALARPSTQLRAIDALADNTELLGSYAERLRGLRALHAERARLEQDAVARSREAEYLAFAADELERANVRSGEEDEIAADLSRLEHVERLSETAARVLALSGSDGASGLLSEAHRALEAACALDPRLAPVAAGLAEAAALAEDASADLRSWLDGLDADPVRVDALRERKALLASLRRKYGDDVPGAGAAARARLAEIQTSSQRLSSLDAEASALRDEAAAIAAELSRRRQDAARRLTEMVGAELPALALPGAVFRAESEPIEEWTESGRDRIAFRFASTAAQRPDLIGKIASGGELSRAMIAVTLALARAHEVPALVFDEADQGVGGEAALELARRLARLGRTHQVLVVSHLPQIAAFADRHLAVRRGRDGVAVEVVTDDERIGEISRMLAGLESSELARGHAGELIDLAAAERAAS